MRNRLLAWRGADPVRYDAASVSLWDERLDADGSSTAADFVVTYRLRTGPRWITRRLDVCVELTGPDGGRRELALERDDDGHWTSTITWAPADRPPETTTAIHPELDGALDCDLGLCPVTNTMPILREDILGASLRGEQRRVELTMAWVAVPELDVLVSHQVYESGTATYGGGAQIHYASDGFSEFIHVDDDALAISYPSIGHRIA